jgi:hypothetical protein
MTHSTATGRRAARTADGEGESWWFYGDRAILRSPEGALPIIIEHHVGPGAAAAASTKSAVFREWDGLRTGRDVIRHDRETSA